MPRTQGGRVESLGDELVPERPREPPEDVAQSDGVVAGRVAAGGDRGAAGQGGGAGWPLGEGARPPDDRAADLRAPAGARGSLRRGRRDAAARALRLAAAAPLLPDPDRRAAAGGSGWRRRRAGRRRGYAPA